MGACSGKIIKSQSSLDVLESTVWIREVLVNRLKKKKSSVSRFKNFIFQPVGKTSTEEISRVSIEYLNGKDEEEIVHWLVRISSNHAGLKREIEIRQKMIPALNALLANRAYKRAKFLLNIPETVFIDCREFGKSVYYHLVLEDVSLTKGCKPPPKHILESGFDLSHMKVVVSTLAQFHAVTIAWKQSIEDDSILDVHPYLARPYPIPAEERILLINRYALLCRSVSSVPLDPKLEKKLNLLKTYSKRVDDETQIVDDFSNPTGTIGLGLVHPEDLLFQYTSVPMSFQVHNSTQSCRQLGEFTFASLPVCSAVTKLSNVSYSSIERDLAVWIFTLGNQAVRQHYLLTLLQSYSFVLTSTLEALGVKWQRLGITFNELAARFFEQIPYAVLSSVLVSIRNITEDDILKFQENPDYELDKSTKILISNDDVNHNTTPTEDLYQKTELSDTEKEFCLTKKKTRFLLHLLNDVQKFI